VGEIYRSFALRHDGFLDRGHYIWHRVASFRDARVLGYGIERDGALVGYVYFTQKSGPEFRYDLMVRDWGGRDARARAAVLELLRDQRSLAEDAVFFGEPWHPDRVTGHEQRHLSVRVHEHWMLRIVDVEAALTARGYPRGVSATLSFDVDDPVVAGNRGRFTLRVSRGRGSVRRGGTKGIALDVAALAALYAGYETPFALADSARLAGPAPMLELATTVFAAPHPTMRDFF
jgi:predicted acetyltransferase